VGEWALDSLEDGRLLTHHGSGNTTYAEDRAGELGRTARGVAHIDTGQKRVCARCTYAPAL
jgi:hypothetical protein